MMSLSEILFLSFIVSAWTAPLTMDVDASSESMELPEPTPLDDITINDQKISVTWPSKPIAEILDPYHRGIHAIQQIADKSYQKLLVKTPQVNFRYTPYTPVIYPVFRQIPVSGSQSIASEPILLPQQISQNANHNKYGTNYIHTTSQIDSLPVIPYDWFHVYQSPNHSSVWKPLIDFLNKFINNNQNKHDGNRAARETMKNVQNSFSPEMIEGFLSTFINKDSVEGTTASPELSDESSESDENQSGSTMTTSATEELLTTTALPTEFESTTTTTFETTTEIPTTKSNEEEIISSTTQSELLDKNAEIDEAVAFNIDGGNISSTQESATQFPKINKDNFYVIYGRPRLTKKDNSLLLNANVGMAVALNESDINDLKITSVV